MVPDAHESGPNLAASVTVLPTRCVPHKHWLVGALGWIDSDLAPMVDTPSPQPIEHVRSVPFRRSVDGESSRFVLPQRNRLLAQLFVDEATDQLLDALAGLLQNKVLTLVGPVELETRG